MSPSHAVSSLRLASPFPPSLREGISLPGPLYPPAEDSWGQIGLQLASPRTGTRRQAYLNTYCVPATTVDSTANGIIVTSSAYEETKAQKNSLFTQDHRVHT